MHILAQLNYADKNVPSTVIELLIFDYLHFIAVNPAHQVTLPTILTHISHIKSYISVLEYRK